MKINKSITMDEKLARKAERLAKKQHRSFSSLVENIVSIYITNIELTHEENTSNVRAGAP